MVIDIGNKFDVGLEHLVSPHVYHWVGTIVIGIGNKYEVGSEHLSSGSATNMMSGWNTWYHPHVECQVGGVVIEIGNNLMLGWYTWYHLMSIVGSEQLSLGSATNLRSDWNTCHRDQQHI